MPGNAPIALPMHPPIRPKSPPPIIIPPPTGVPCERFGSRRELPQHQTRLLPRSKCDRHFHGASTASGRFLEDIRAGAEMAGAVDASMKSARRLCCPCRVSCPRSERIDSAPLRLRFPRQYCLRLAYFCFVQTHRRHQNRCSSERNVFCVSHERRVTFLALTSARQAYDSFPSVTLIRSDC